jgi:hypothetical protein
MTPPKLFTLLALLTGLVLSACGRPNVVYSDGAAIVSSGTPDILPTGFQDQSINHGEVSTAADFGITPSLQFHLFGGSSATGSFNDTTAVGNRALLGVQKYDHSGLANFGLAVTSASDTSSALHISILVDLLCDGTTPLRTLETSNLALGSSTANTTDSIWSIDGAALKDASNNVVLASVADATPSGLTAMLAAYPTACLKNGHSDAPDAPTGSVGSVVLSIGSNSSTTVESLTVSTLKINGDVYHTWGQP